MTGSPRWTRTTTKMTPVNSRPLCQLSYGGIPANLANKVHAADTGCWEWTGARSGRGYGSLCIPGTGRSALAHRWFYEALVGPIPDGLTIDHLCFNKICVNPDHLEAVTGAENTRRAAWKQIKSECKNGHDTTYPDSRVKGQCVACRYERAERETEARRARTGVARTRKPAQRPEAMQALVDQMRDHGLSQRSVARAIGVHEMNLSNYLRGKTLVPADVLARIDAHLASPELKQAA